LAHGIGIGILSGRWECGLGSGGRFDIILGFHGFVDIVSFGIPAGFKLVYYLIGQTALLFDSIYYEHTIFIDSGILIDGEVFEWSSRAEEPPDSQHLYEYNLKVTRTARPRT